MTTCSCLSSWLYGSALLYFGCSNFHLRLRHDLMIVFSSEYVVVVSIRSGCAHCLARVSGSSLPLKPQWAWTHCTVILYLLGRSVSFVKRLCCSLSLLLLIDWRTERASVRNTHFFWSFHFFQGLLLPLLVPLLQPCSLYYVVLLIYWHALHYLQCAVHIHLLLHFLQHPQQSHPYRLVSKSHKGNVCWERHLWYLFFLLESEASCPQCLVFSCWSLGGLLISMGGKIGMLVSL